MRRRLRVAKEVVLLDAGRMRAERYPPPVLRTFASRVLVGAGLADTDATAAADCLVAANLRGVGSHGVLRLIQYAAAIRAGEVNVRPRVRIVRRTGATAIVDADGGYGFTPAMLAIETAVDIAADHGIGAVGVRASHHFGMALTFALRAAERGAIGIVTTNSVPVLGPPGARRAVVGNNPIAVAAPRPGHDPIAVDMALSEVAWGKISLAAAEGRPIPHGWAFDDQGRPTTDAAAAMAASVLAPIGGHKGFALALALELLNGVLTDSRAGLDADGHRFAEGGVGHFAIAIRPSAFLTPDRYAERVERLIGQVHATPRSDRAGAMLIPGERSWTTFHDRVVNGVPVSAELRGRLDALAVELGVPPLTTQGTFPRRSTS